MGIPTTVLRSLAMAILATYLPSPCDVPVYWLVSGEVLGIDFCSAQSSGELCISREIVL